MGFFSMLNNVLWFLLQLNPTLAIFIISIITVTITTLVYKHFSDQVKIKSIKDEVNQLNDEMKKNRSDLNKVMQLQNTMLSKNMELMSLTLKPSLYTLLPMMFIFLWLSSVFSQTPIYPDSHFNVVIDKYDKAQISFLNANESYAVLKQFNQFELINTSINDKEINAIFKAPKNQTTITVMVENKPTDIIIANHPFYFERSISTENYSVAIKTDKLIILNLFGWQIGYIGSYILFSLVINFVVRKILDVH